ncbi:LOW QUALITY PROTEIN: NELL2-interacting cell ontogeny regulator 1-like [Rhynchonycteris naso]
MRARAPSARPCPSVRRRHPPPPPPPPCRPLRPRLLLLLSVAVLAAQARAEPVAGSTDPAQSRPCVDCHAFEFMQRALQDLRKTAYSLDTRTDTLLLQAERRALCACWPSGL